MLPIEGSFVAADKVRVLLAEEFYKKDFDYGKTMANVTKERLPGRAIRCFPLLKHKTSHADVHQDSHGGHRTNHR